MLIKRWLLVCLVCLLLVSCSDSGESPEKSSNEHIENPEGLWIGQQTVLGNGVYDLNTIIYDGRIMGISEDAGVLYSGTYEMASGQFLVSDGSEAAESETDYMLYDLYNNGNAFARGIISAKVDEKHSLNGVFENQALQEGEFKSSYTTLFEKEASIEYITGNWNNSILDISISPDGDVSGTVNGCTVSGFIDAPEVEKNIYLIDYTLTECSLNGAYSGLGFISDIEGNPYFTALMDSGSRMDFIGFQVNTMPKSTTSSLSSTSATKLSPMSRASSLQIASDQTYFGGGWAILDLKGGSESNYSGEEFSNLSIDLKADGADFSDATFDNVDLLLSTPVGGVDPSNHWVSYDPDPIIMNSDFSGSTFNNSSILTGGLYKHVASGGDLAGLEVTTIEDTDFSDVHFNGGPFEIYAKDTDFSRSVFSGELFMATYFCDYIKADFTDVAFIGVDVSLSYGTQRVTSWVYYGDFTGANFESVDIDNIWPFASKFNYANFEGAKNIFLVTLPTQLNILGNAWWYDGSRCNAASVGLCLPKVYDNGLTYEEYLSGKSDLEKDAELLAGAIENKAKEGLSFVKDTWSSFWD